MSKRALEIIQECLSKENDTKPDAWEPVETFINMRYPDFKVDTIDKYDLNIESIEILHEEYHESEPDQWDGDFVSQIVFSFDKGYALAVHSGWWGPTFSGNTHVLDIYEYDDYDGFDRTCLTSELREKMIDVLAHRILLNAKP